MALSAAHLNHIRHTQNLARLMLDSNGGIQQSKILWSGAPGYQVEITQADIDENFPDSGLTVANLADAQYVLALIGDNINNAMVALTVLTNLP